MNTPSTFELPFTEQIRFLRSKIRLPTQKWDDIKKAAHDRAFIVAGAEKADLLSDLHKAVQKAVESGTTLATFRKDFRKIVEQHGWTGWTGEGTKAGTAWRTRVIYETNLRASYAAGRWAQLNDPGLLKLRPYWRYVHADTVVTPRPQHLAWDGLVLRHDHPFWQTHFPPNGWGCRCRVVAVTEPGEGDRTEPLEGWDIPDEKTGAPKGIDKGWDYAPGANTATPLADLVDRKLFNLDAAIGASMWESLAPAIEMEWSLRWANTLDDWLSDPIPRGRFSVVGGLPDNTIKKLVQRNLPFPKTAEICIFDRLVVGKKQRRHEAAQNGLSIAEWRQIPRIIRRAERVYLDKHSGKLVFVGGGSVSMEKIVVEFDPTQLKKAAGNQIDTAFRVSADDVESAIKGGLWEEL